jgi:hypothetical protein
MCGCMGVGLGDGKGVGSYRRYICHCCVEWLVKLYL